MTHTAPLRLAGVFKPGSVQPGFGIPVFESEHGLVVQTVVEEIITGFIACSIGSAKLARATGIVVEDGVDLYAEPTRAIGQRRMYAFALPGGSLIVGERRLLADRIRLSLCELTDVGAFTLLDIAEFLCDEILLVTARAKIEAAITEARAGGLIAVTRERSASESQHGTRSDNIRNIGILAHAGGRKTSIRWQSMFQSRRRPAIGSYPNTRDGISSTVLAEELNSLLWRSQIVNVIDNPGIVEFCGKGIGSRRVLSGAVVMFDGVSGIEPQSETNWRLVKNSRVPGICYVDNIDRNGANFLYCVKMLKEHLGIRALPLQLPIGSENDFQGVVDLVEMKALLWERDRDAEPRVHEVTSDLADRLGIRRSTDREILAGIAKYRSELVSACLEQDATANEAYVSQGTVPSADTLRRSLRRGTITSAINPVLCGSSYNNRGITQLLHAIVDYLPTLTEVDRGQLLDHLNASASERVAAQGLVPPPQLYYDGLVRRLLSPSAYHRYISPHIVDMYDEYFERLVKSDEAGARWVVIRSQIYIVPSLVRALIGALVARALEIVR